MLGRVDVLIMNSATVGQAIFLAGGTIILYIWLRSRYAQLRSASQSPTDHGSRERPLLERVGRKGVHLSLVNSFEDETKPDVDIIAIHGLDTKSPDTWIWKSKGAADVNWLSDKYMLPSRVGPARIFTCDWPAGMFQESNMTQMTIKESARLLLAGIQKVHTQEVQRPILFIASCLGGIILMQALDMAEHEYLPIRKATRGVIFLATPFRGTAFQDVAAWAEPGLKAWAAISDREVIGLLENVKSTTQVEELVRQFTTLCEDLGLSKQVTTFYEKGKTSLPHRMFPWLPAWIYDAKPVSLNRVPI